MSEPKPYTIWALHCPFTKKGIPVVGTMGATVRGVIVFSIEEWDRLCADVPQLATTQFRVGS